MGALEPVRFAVAATSSRQNKKKKKKIYLFLLPFFIKTYFLLLGTVQRYVKLVQWLGLNVRTFLRKGRLADYRIAEIYSNNFAFEFSHSYMFRLLRLALGLGWGFRISRHLGPT